MTIKITVTQMEIQRISNYLIRYGFCDWTPPTVLSDFDNFGVVGLILV